MELFYTDQPVNDLIIPGPEESKHLVKVLRHKLGDTIWFTNGKGDLVKTIIERADPKNCTLKVISVEREFGKRSYTIHVAVAPTKNTDRLEWFAEKATELGIDEITPIICEHSERRIIKTDRLQKILVAAMKQSVKTYLPVLNEAATFNEFIGMSSGAKRFICTMGAGEDSLLKVKYERGKDVIIIVGPEGDFSEKEILAAKENQIEVVSLGQSRLRTETAALMAVATIHIVNQ